MNQDDVSGIIKIAKESNTLNVTLEDYCNRFVEIQGNIKEKNKILKDIRENNVKWPEYKELQEQAKEIRASVQTEPEYQEMKEEIDDLKDQKEMTENVIMSLLREKDVVSFDFSEGNFVREEKVKYKKNAEDPENSKRHDDFKKSLV